jgi:hypothetical protein
MIPNPNFRLIGQPFSKYRHHWNNFPAIGGFFEVGEKHLKYVVGLAYIPSVNNIQNPPTPSSYAAVRVSPGISSALF